MTPPPPLPWKPVSSLANPTVKLLRLLHEKKGREDHRLFLAEGEKLVRDGLAAGWRCAVLVASPERAGEAIPKALAGRVAAAGGEAIAASREVLEKIGRRDNPATLLAAFEPRFAPLDLSAPDGLFVVLDRVRDPGNLGTILRTADAAGASAVILVGQSCDPFGPEAVRATMGALFAVPLMRAEARDFVATARRAGVRLLGTHLAASIDFRAADYARPVALLMGNEREGLPDDLAAASDTLIHIPMRVGADSLNLAVSTGIVLYEALRGRAPSMGAAGRPVLEPGGGGG